MPAEVRVTVSLEKAVEALTPVMAEVPTVAVVAIASRSDVAVTVTVVSEAETGATAAGVIVTVAVVVAVATTTVVLAPESGRGAGVVVTRAVQSSVSWLRFAALNAETNPMKLPVKDDPMQGASDIKILEC